MEGLFNQWAKVRITDAEVKKLIQIAMAPNKEVLENLAEDQLDRLSAHYTNIVDNVYEYAQGSPTQQMDTTAGTVFGAYNAVSGYFQNMRNFKTKKLNSNRLWMVWPSKGHKPHLIYAGILQRREAKRCFITNHNSGGAIPLSLRDCPAAGYRPPV